MSTTQTTAALWEERIGQHVLDSPDVQQTILRVPSDAPQVRSSQPDRHGISLVKRIGRGGFADVYSARQHALHREVAVKQIRDQERGSHLRSFHHEVWLTAGLNHPNILPIHGLVRIEGRPSLVMKRVHGQAWGERLEALRSEGRFVLHHEIQRLVSVCDAVAFAHSRGVLHLDLKPANVMCGAFGETLVMDWGCAALFDDRQWAEQTDLPRTSKITKPFGTPAFMAPELAQGEGNALGPHTDIYLLGAILHVLLTGEVLRMGETIRSTIEMAAQGVRRPLPETAPTQLAALCRQATEADISNRLSDMKHFRDTLQHWLDTRESQELTERALETLSAMERAETLTAAQRQEGKQLLGVLEQAGRSGMQLPQAIAGEWRLRQLLAQTALKNGEPAVARVIAMPMPKHQRENIQQQAQTLQGQRTNSHIRDWSKRALTAGRGSHVETRLLRILEHQRQVLGEHHPDTLRTKDNVAQLYAELGRHEAALTMLHDTLRIREAMPNGARIDALKNRRDIAYMLLQQSKVADAERQLSTVMDIQRRVLGEEHPDTIESASTLATLLRRLYRYDEAERLFLDVLERSERIFGAAHPTVLIIMSNLALLYKIQERYDKAEPLYLQSLQRKEQQLGVSHPETLIGFNNLGMLYLAQGRHDAAEVQLKRAWERSRKMLGDEHPLTVGTASGLAQVYSAQGRHDEAEPLYVYALETGRRVLGEDHLHTRISVGNLAKHHMTLKRWEKAEALYAERLAMWERIHGASHPQTVMALSSLLWCQLDRGGIVPREGFTRLLQARSDPQHINHHLARFGLALCTLQETGDAEPAHQSLQDITNMLHPEHPQVIWAQQLMERMQARHAQQRGLSEC